MFEKQRFNPLFFSKTPQDQPKLLELFNVVILVGLIGWIDHATGWEYSLFVLYALPIVFVVWKTDRSFGFVFAFLCAMTWWWAHSGSNPYQSSFGYSVAVFGRLFYFAVLVIAVAALKGQQELYRERIESLENEQKLERDILWASEREQQRIGRDLHDSLGTHLASIGYAAAFLANDLRQQDQPEATKAEHIHELVNNAGSLLRDLIQGIFPEQMDGLGLSIAIEELASTTSRQSGLSVSFYETGDILIEDPEVCMHLYRIVQEAVNNAAKHGDAKKVTIVLNQGEHVLRLTIVDDGKGMAPLPNSQRGMGLSSMRYRARTLGGDLKIESNPSGGTIVSCEIPNRALLPATPTS